VRVLLDLFTVKFLGVGEKETDLVPMDPRAFVDALLPSRA